MTNKMNTYIENLNHTISRTTNPTDVRILTDIQGFLGSLNELFGHPTVISGPVQMELGQGLPVGRTIEMFSPVPVPSAPGAVQLSSGVAPQVEGCIAAQPNTIMQQAAQQRLNQLLAEQEAEKKAKQEAFNQGLAQAQSQDALTASLLQQMVKTAPVAATPVVSTGEVMVPAPVEQKEMTLAEFVASQKAPVAPAGEMTLADFVKSQQAAQPQQVDVQAQFNALLAAQQDSQPGASSPLA